MNFEVGDNVVYPHHGAATIEKKEKKDVFGEKKDYLILKLAYGDLTLMVPARMPLATRRARSLSAPNTVPDSPKIESLAMRTASSSSS